MSQVGAGGDADRVPPDELVALVQRYWPWSEWSNALAISLKESGWDNEAFANTVDDAHPCGAIVGTFRGQPVSAERSVGYFQLNLCNYPSEVETDLRTPEGNVAEAHALWAARGWQPWYFTALELGLL